MRIGIDLGGTKIEAIALSETGKDLYRERIPTPNDYLQTLDSISSLVSKIESIAGTGDSIGIGIPGTISSTTNSVKNANSLWLNNMPLVADIERTLKRPVRIANDANCLAVSEAVDGAGAGFNVVFGVIIGTGCGGGIAIDGRAHTGINGVSGEWGHNPLPWPNEEDLEYQQKIPCYCGRRGCVETYVSGPGFSKDYKLHTGQTLEAYKIVDLALKGENDAKECLERYQQRLGKALAGIVNTLDPDVIVLGGGMSNVESIYYDIESIISGWVFGTEFQTQILKAKHGDSSGVRGAAWLW